MMRFATLMLALAACSSNEPAPTSAPSAAQDAPLLKGDFARTWQWADFGITMRGDANDFYGLVSNPTTHNMSAIYHSTDGTTWDRRAMLDDGTNADSFFSGAAYGSGRLVAVGTAKANTGKISLSTDGGTTWQPQSAVAPLFTVDFVNGLFIAGGMDAFMASADGMSWTTIPRPAIEVRGSAFGNGTYVVFGACGVTMTSTDGKTWTDTSLAPTTTPNCPQNLSNGFFGEGKFWSQLLSSPDGKTWTPIQDGPLGGGGGYLFTMHEACTDDCTYGLLAWHDGEPRTAIAVNEAAKTLGTNWSDALPASFTVPYSNNATCLDHRCLVLDQNLFLID